MGKSKSTPLSRRRLLRRAALFAIAASTSGVERVLAIAGIQPGERLSHRAVVGSFRDPDAAAEIGRRYLALHPNEARLDVLASAISLSPSEGHLTAWKRRISARHREDFRAGDVAVVDGWILSRTEARLCAVVALFGGRPRVR